MAEFREYKIKATGVKSLSWEGDCLVDWIGGCITYHLDGHYKASDQLVFPYRFDAVTKSSSGTYTVLYERRGTKALLLQGQEILRELNRTYYHANDYDYPVAFIQLNDGREIVAHCPEKYCRLDFEEVLSGKILTFNSDRNPDDFFHSGLAASPSGRFLMDAGWAWHPWESVFIYDVQSALDQPKVLDGTGVPRLQSAEFYGGAFIDDRTAILLTSSEEEMESTDIWDRPNLITTYDIFANEYKTVVCAEEHVGDIMPIGDRYMVSFFDHPKLFDLQTGKVLHRWNNLKSGNRLGSLCALDKRPPLALDMKGKRFAVADENEITVIEIISPE